MNQPKIITYILDDQQHWLDLIKDMLSVDDYFEVAYFAKPDDFFENFSKDIDLVITDVRVPNYDVLATVETISKINPSCYIIVMSAYFDVNIMKALMRLRVDDVVEKTSSINWIQDLRVAIERLKPRLIEKMRTKQ